MAMEGIPTKAVVSRAVLQPGEAPTHTHPDHVQCAYYVTTEIRGADDELDGPMVCPHGAAALGAFYSEDHIRQLKEISHRLISHFENLDHFKEGPFTGEHEQYEPFYKFRDLGVKHWDEEVMGDLIARLRELTR